MHVYLRTVIGTLATTKAMETHGSVRRPSARDRNLWREPSVCLRHAPCAPYVPLGKLAALTGRDSTTDRPSSAQVVLPYGFFGVLYVYALRRRWKTVLVKRPMEQSLSSHKCLE